MYFGEQNILKYMHLNAREFLETAAQNLGNYRPQGTEKPILPVLKQYVAWCCILHIILIY